MDLLTQTQIYLKDIPHKQKGHTFYIAHTHSDIDPLKLILKESALFLVTTIHIHDERFPEILMDINLETTYGNFDYDLNTKTLYYRASVDLNNRPYSKALLEHLCNAPLIDIILLKKQLSLN